MSAQSIHGEGDVRDFYGQRALDSKCLPLKALLVSGASVLDVGCSVGSITCDVAGLVKPGLVFGIDAEGSAIPQANELARLDISNIAFKAGDAYALEFDDNTFDITYSLALLVWLRDPVAALQEQKRVTKPGGWVAASIGDFGTIITYPSCPALEQVISAFGLLAAHSIESGYVNFNLGRQALVLFSQAGFHDIRLEAYVPAAEQAYAGSEFIDESHGMFLFMTDVAGPAKSMLHTLMEQKVLVESTILAAREEVVQWAKHPHAFTARTTVFAAGRVP